MSAIWFYCLYLKKLRLLSQLNCGKEFCLIYNKYQVELGKNLKRVRFSESKCESNCHLISVPRKHLLLCNMFFCTRQCSTGPADSHFLLFLQTFVQDFFDGESAHSEACINVRKEVNRTKANIQGVPGVKATISGFNSRADSEPESYIHVGPIRNFSGVRVLKVQ